MSLQLQHLSPSSIRTFLDNPHKFYAQYILKRPIHSDLSASIIEGSWVHKYLEVYWKTRIEGSSHIGAVLKVHQYIAASETELLIDLSREIITFGKTGSLEKSVAVIKKATAAYLDEVETLFKDFVPFKSEHVLQDNLVNPETGEVIDIPLKGVVDLIVTQGDKQSLIDHKIVAAHTSDEKMPAKYILPACLYYLLYEATTGIKLDAIFYDEIKKSTNKNGTPQVKRIVIQPKPHYLAASLNIFEAIVQRIQSDALYLPNPFAQMGGDDVFEDFAMHTKLKNFN